MANYYGNDIGDAARAEERALERSLNLALANRSFLANERARSDSIDAQNAAARQNAYSQALALEQADRTNLTNLTLNAEDRKYNRGQDEYRLRLGLQEAEKGRALQRELYGKRQDQYDERLQVKEADTIYRDIARRIGGNDIMDVPALQDAEGGRLSSDQWVDLKTRLGQHQQRLKTEAALGPEQAALEANAILQSDPLFSTATTPQAKAQAMVNVMTKLDASRVYSGKITPDVTTFTFKPRLEYKYTGGTDAIEPTTYLPKVGMGDRLALDAELNRNFATRMAVEPAPPVAPADTSVRVAPPTVSLPAAAPPSDPRAEEVRSLIAKGIPRDQAILLVARKYQRLKGAMGNREPIRTY